MAVVVLVRHGQASFGAADYDVLSEVGERQAGIVARRLAALPGLERVVTGAMVRQRGTAEPLLAARPDVASARDPRFDEYDHVELLRRSAADDGTDLEAELAAADDPRRTFQRVFDRAVARWTAGEHDDYHESYRGFRRRVRAGLDGLVSELEGTAVVITSGGVIAAVVADALGLDEAGWTRVNRVIVNTSLTKLVRGRRGTNLVTVNDHAHLEAEAAELLTYR